MKIVECKQGTPEWFAARVGIPTASEFDNLVSPGKWEPRTGETPKTYLARKLAEDWLGTPLLSGAGWAADQGSTLEQEAIPWYEFEHDVEVRRVGFVTTDDGRIGCSPDGLIGEDSGLEVKCPEPPTHIKYLLAGEVPKDYLAQVHGSMFVTGRPTWTFLSYCRRFPALVVTVERDDRIHTALSEALEAFLERFDQCKAKLSGMGGQPATAAQDAPSTAWKPIGELTREEMLAEVGDGGNLF